MRREKRIRTHRARLPDSLCRASPVFFFLCLPDTPATPFVRRWNEQQHRSGSSSCLVSRVACHARRRSFHQMCAAPPVALALFRLQHSLALTHGSRQSRAHTTCLPMALALRLGETVRHVSLLRSLLMSVSVLCSRSRKLYTLCKKTNKQTCLTILSSTRSAHERARHEGVAATAGALWRACVALLVFFLWF